LHYMKDRSASQTPEVMWPSVWLHDEHYYKKKSF
jgi:hypothetical protein